MRFSPRPLRWPRIGGKAGFASLSAPSCGLRLNESVARRKRLLRSVGGPDAALVVRPSRPHRQARRLHHNGRGILSKPSIAMSTPSDVRLQEISEGIDKACDAFEAAWRKENWGQEYGYEDKTVRLQDRIQLRRRS